MTLRKVRTTIRPDEEIEVDDAEYRTLRASGLLAKSATPAPPKPQPAPAAAPTVARAATGTGDNASEKKEIG